MSIISDAQKYYTIRDIQLKEIETEEIIKKIYEGGTTA